MLSSCSSAFYDNICCIIDFEAFQHKDYLGLREIGLCDLHLTTVKNYQIYPNNLPLWDKLARKSFNFVKYKIHGLDFYPSKKNSSVVHEKQVKDLVINFYNDHKKDQNSFVAFKGGSIERNLLEQLHIPYFNLEDIKNCPTIKNISKEHLACKYYCNLHVNCQDGFKHCSSVEVAFYAMWLNTKHNLCCI